MQTVFLLLGCCSDTATDSGDAAKYNLTWFAHKKVEHMKGSAGETLDSTKQTASETPFSATSSEGYFL